MCKLRPPRSTTVLTASALRNLGSLAPLVLAHLHGDSRADTCIRSRLRNVRNSVNLAHMGSRLALLAIAVGLGLSSVGCASPAIGAPCLPEQVPENGFDDREAYVESSSVQCETRVCVVFKLRGDPREGCVARDPNPTTGDPRQGLRDGQGRRRSRVLLVPLPLPGRLRRVRVRRRLHVRRPARAGRPRCSRRLLHQERHVHRRLSRGAAGCNARSTDRGASARSERACPSTQGDGRARRGDGVRAPHVARVRRRRAQRARRTARDRHHRAPRPAARVLRGAIARSNYVMTPAQSVDHRKVARIRQAAVLWLRADPSPATRSCGSTSRRCCSTRPTAASTTWKARSRSAF